MATYYGEHDASEHAPQNLGERLIAFVAAAVSAAHLFVALFTSDVVALFGAVLFLTVAGGSLALSALPRDEKAPLTPATASLTTLVVALVVSLIASPVFGVILRLVATALVFAGVRAHESLVVAAREATLRHDHEQLLKDARNRATAEARRVARERERELVADSEVRVRAGLESQVDLEHSLSDEATSPRKAANDVDADEQGRVA